MKNSKEGINYTFFTIFHALYRIIVSNNSIECIRATVVLASTVIYILQPLFRVNIIIPPGLFKTPN